jgi:iron complex transport system permease protein
MIATTKRKWLGNGLAAMALIALLLASLALGPVTIPLSTIKNALLGRDSESTASIIIFFSRLPRMLTALLAGAGLAACSLLMQALFRNPLAGPSVLGITSGASFGAALLVLSGTFLGFHQIFKASIVAAAMTGAIGALALVFLVASRVREQYSILVFGIMLGFLVSAVVSILQYKAPPELLRQFVLWGMGSFADANYRDILLLTGIILPSIILCRRILPALFIFQMGSEDATALGVNLRKLQFSVILLAGLTAGGITSVCGPIAFIGMAAPHLAKWFVKSGNLSSTFTLTILIGACTAVCSDLASRLFDLPLNAITSALSAPVVLFILFSSLRK